MLECVGLCYIYTNIYTNIILTYKSFDENSSAQLEGEKERGREREGGGKMEKREMIREK